MIKYAQNDFFPLCSTNPLFTRAIQRNHQLLWRWLNSFSWHAHRSDDVAVTIETGSKEMMPAFYMTRWSRRNTRNITDIDFWGTWSGKPACFIWWLSIHYNIIFLWVLSFGYWNTRVLLNFVISTTCTKTIVRLCICPVKVN